MAAGSKDRDASPGADGPTAGAITAPTAGASAPVTTRQIVAFDGAPAGTRAAPPRSYNSASTPAGTSAAQPAIRCTTHRHDSCSGQRQHQHHRHRVIPPLTRPPIRHRGQTPAGHSASDRIFATPGLTEDTPAESAARSPPQRQWQTEPRRSSVVRLRNTPVFPPRSGPARRTSPKRRTRTFSATLSRACSRRRRTRGRSSETHPDVTETWSTSGWPDGCPGRKFLSATNHRPRWCVR